MTKKKTVIELADTYKNNKSCEKLINFNMPQPIVQLKDLEITYNLGKENAFKATRGGYDGNLSGRVCGLFRAFRLW
jgi:hypothetical protein